MPDGRGEALFIDSHVHVLPPWRMAGLVRWLKRVYPAHPIEPDVTEDQVVDDLRARGVTHFFNLAYPLSGEETESLNQWNLEFCERTSGAIPFASLHQDTADKVQVASDALEAGFAGLKFHPFVQGFDPWDPRFDGLYAFMEEAGRPVLLHTGFEAFYRMAMPVGELIGLARRYPGLPLVFVHMAFPDMGAVFEAMDELPEIYLDATNVFACFRDEFAPLLDAFAKGRDLREELLEGLDRHQSRIMFGSDHPVGMGSYDDIHADLEAMVSPERARALRSGAPRDFIERFLPGFDWRRRL